MEEILVSLPTGIAALAAILSPVLVDLLVKSSWSAATKNWVATAIVALIALVYTSFVGGFTFDASASFIEVAEVFAVGILSAYGLQQALFQFVFRKTRLHNALKQKGVSDGEADTDGENLRGSKLSVPHTAPINPEGEVVLEEATNAPESAQEGRLGY